ncbi:MAG: hypothetical protein ACLP5E_14780 [Streptosporangiaceae bacterium]
MAPAEPNTGGGELVPPGESLVRRPVGGFHDDLFGGVQGERRILAEPVGQVDDHGRSLPGRDQPVDQAGSVQLRRRCLLLVLAGLACVAGLASFWARQGQAGPVPRLVARSTACSTARSTGRAGAVCPGTGRDGYLGWKRSPPSNRMTSAFM